MLHFALTDLHNLGGQISAVQKSSVKAAHDAGSFHFCWSLSLQGMQLHMLEGLLSGLEPGFSVRSTEGQMRFAE